MVRFRVLRRLLGSSLWPSGSVSVLFSSLLFLHACIRPSSLFVFRRTGILVSVAASRGTQRGPGRLSKWLLGGLAPSALSRRTKTNPSRSEERSRDPKNKRRYSWGSDRSRCIYMHSLRSDVGPLLSGLFHLSSSSFSFFFLFLPFFFEKRSPREKQAFQRRSKLFAAVTSFDYSARLGRTAILRGKRVLRRNTRTQRCNRKEQCKTYLERRECWLRWLHADSANLDISWLLNRPSTFSFHFIFYVELPG